jgi:hypothetical protein
MIKRKRFQPIVNDLRKIKEKFSTKFEKDTYPVCKKFGCGKKLTPMEYLCSEFCFKHQQEKNQKK